MNQTVGICRLCLESEKPLITSIQNGTFRTRLATVSSFVFEDNEQLPSGVCPECSERVNQFYSFMEAVRCNQQQLHLLAQPIQVKNEIILDPPCEQLETTVKVEEPSFEMMHADEDPANEDEYAPLASSSIKQEKRTKLTNVDGLIKEYLSLKCDTCQESFETFAQLKTHSRKIHNKQPVLHCCNKRFSVKRQVLFHIKNHLKPCKCHECGRGYPDKTSLKYHYTNKHMTNDEKPEKPFKCNKCRKSFHTEAVLQAHCRRLHSLVDCPVCQRSLSDKNLKGHMAAVHNNETKYICEVCGKDFKSSGAKSSHILTHGAQKYECEVCGKRFKRSCYLKDHIGSHTSQKQYACEFCGIEMIFKTNLYSHKRKKHPAEWMQAKQRGDQA